MLQVCCLIFNEPMSSTSVFPEMKTLHSFQVPAVALTLLTLLSGCEVPPKVLPATSTGQKISIVDIDDDTLIRIYHAQEGAAPMNRETVLSTLVSNRSSRFSDDAINAQKASDATARERLKNAVFKEFSDSVSKTPVGTVIAIPVSFSVSPYDPQAKRFNVCVDGICASPFLLKQGEGAYKLNLTVTSEKFLHLSSPQAEAKILESHFDAMGRNGHAILYAKVDRLSHDARYAPTLYASVFRVSLKATPTYSNPTAQGIYRFPELAEIQVGPSP